MVAAEGEANSEFSAAFTLPLEDFIHKSLNKSMNFTHLQPGFVLDLCLKVWKKTPTRLLQFANKAFIVYLDHEGKYSMEVFLCI